MADVRVSDSSMELQCMIPQQDLQQLARMNFFEDVYEAEHLVNELYESA